MNKPTRITRRVAVYLDLALDPNHPLGATLLSVDDRTASRAVSGVLREQPFADAFTDANEASTWAHLSVAPDNYPF